MSMICYTRNFEDVMLQRVFADIPQGHFIDVGASMPIQDSNTFALYQKGWRGVSIEPLEYQDHWLQARPEDIFLNAAVGSQPGQLTLQVYDHAQQISSGSVAIHEHWERDGKLPSRSLEVPILTLDQIITVHLPDKPIQLLSIDVEGMEREVLCGINLNRHRPWVVIVEATLPGTRQPSHADWEPILVNAGYSFMYFDGVNRFYLAQEHHHLSDRFALPPNVWDDFVTIREVQLQTRVGQLQAHVDLLQQQVDVMRAALEKICAEPSDPSSIGG